MTNMRYLTESEITKLSSRKGVKAIAVENYLGSMGDDATSASMNLTHDAKSYKWNAATVKAIRDGIVLARRPAPVTT